MLSLSNFGASHPPFAMHALLLHKQVRVSVLLRLSSQHEDLFQLSGELLSADGAVLGRATRTHMPLSPMPLLRLARHVALAPCYALGMCTDTSTVRGLRQLCTHLLPPPRPTPLTIPSYPAMTEACVLCTDTSTVRLVLFEMAPLTPSPHAARSPFS